MKRFSCVAIRRKLQAFYDGELAMGDQMAVSAHLGRCGACAAALADLERVGSLLRASAPGRAIAGALSCEEAAALRASVVNRAKAEHDASLWARLEDALQDMNLVYNGLGAAAASVVCIVVALGMMRFGAGERPDSLAAMVNAIALAGSNEYPMVVNARIMMPRSLDDAFQAPANIDVDGVNAGRDGVFMLSAVVTREGRITNLELLDPPGSSEGADSASGAAKAVEGLLDAVSRARFEPARREGLPVAVNMVWLVAHTTVRASQHHRLRGISSPQDLQELPPTTPGGKKHIALSRLSGRKAQGLVLA